MENLALLTKNQKKVSMLFALLVFLFIYLLIILFELTSAYFYWKIEDNNLMVQAERVTAITKNYNLIEEVSEENPNKILIEILDNTYIWDGTWTVVNFIDIPNIHSYTLPYWEIQKIDSYKILKTKILKGDKEYYSITANRYKSIKSLIGFTIVLMVIFGPIFYGILVYISNLIVREFYKPLRKTIVNLESFASNINHEFKTSLSEIISSLDLAEITWEYQEANTYAVQSAKRLNSTLDTLWIMIHFVDSSYRKERVNIVQTLDSALDDYSTLIENKNIQIEKKYDLKTKKFIYIDRAPLILSFQNILKNAIKYSEEWWKIEIYIEKNEFRIKDYGVWINKENLEKIFDRYFRESYNKSGSGIGLSIIKRITEIYKWEIDIKSEKNKYTEVTIRF